MSDTLLHLLAQRRPATLLTQEAPSREELESVLRAVAGPSYDEQPAGWRVAITTTKTASDLAAAMTGMAMEDIPTMTGPIPRLKGKALRRLAAYRGTLQWASTGGVGLALIFQGDPDSERPIKRQREDVVALRGLLEATFYAQGWSTRWSRRKAHQQEPVRNFYDLKDNEEVLGWLFVGRAAARSIPSPTVNLPPRPLEISYL